MKTYYYIQVNDGVQWSEEIATLKQARKTLKDIIFEDKQVCGCGVGNYRIIKVTETDKTIEENIIYEVYEN